MTMHPCQTLLLLLYVTAYTVLGVPIANIDCGDVCSATPGSNYTLSCTWSGTLTTGIIWKRNGTDVMVCNEDGDCFPSTVGYASGRYSNSTTATLTINSFNATADARNWECTDGSDPSKSCTLPSVARGSLEGKCSSDYKISCYGITDHGNPSARIDLMEGNTTLASTTSGGSVSSMQTDAAGKTYSCSVTGAAAVCLTPKGVDITCSECDEDDARIIAIVVGVVSPSIAAIVGVIIYCFLGKASKKVADAVLAAGICLIAVGFSCLVAILVVCTNVSGTSAPIALALSIIMIIGGIVLIITSKMGCWNRCCKGHKEVTTVPLENGKPENGSPDNRDHKAAQRENVTPMCRDAVRSASSVKPEVGGSEDPLMTGKCK